MKLRVTTATNHHTLTHAHKRRLHRAQRSARNATENCCRQKNCNSNLIDAGDFMKVKVALDEMVKAGKVVSFYRTTNPTPAFTRLCYLDCIKWVNEKAQAIRCHTYRHINYQDGQLRWSISDLPSLFRSRLRTTCKFSKTLTHRQCNRTLGEIRTSTAR